MPQCISALIYITAFMLPNEKILRDFQMEVPNIRFGSAIKLKAGGKATCFDQALEADLLASAKWCGTTSNAATIAHSCRSGNEQRSRCYRVSESSR